MGETIAIRNAKILLYRHFFSSWSGLSFLDWLTLLGEHRFRVSPRYLPRALFVTLASTASSASRLMESIRQAQWEKVEVPSPLFILGHWRSGTTYLHQLLSLDPAFHSPTMEEVLFPHSILTTNPMAWCMKPFLPEDRGVDRVALGVHEPFEDEFALAMLSRISPYFGWAFPSQQQHHDDALRLLDPALRRRWTAALRTLAQKLVLKHGRPPLFKSPPHTARIQAILEVFPDARFVHIHRHPAEVFASTVKLIEEGIDGLKLERASQLPVADQVLRRYCLLYEGYFEDLPLIPPGRWVEIPYAQLEQQPIETLAGMYAQLQLPGWPSVKSSIKQHLSQRPRYQKNSHAPLDPHWMREIKNQWEPIYARWRYEVGAGR